MISDIAKLKEIVLAAGGLLEGARLDQAAVSSKAGHQNFVTVYDKKVQNFLEQKLGEAYPDCLFIAEEQEEREEAGLRPCFIVDPIDGTSNFIHGVPIYAISVAFVSEGRVRQGVVYNPVSRELYWAEEGKGAWLGEERLNCPNQPLALSLFCVGMSPYYAELLPATLALMAKLQPAVTDLRRLGAAALDLCYIAAGRQGGFCEWRLQPWDYAAGMLIAREAGARVTLIDSEELPPLNRPSSLLACGPQAYDEFRKLVNIPALKKEFSL